MLTHQSDGAMHEAVAAIAGCGVSPLVRIAANESWMVKSALPSLANQFVLNNQCNRST